MNQDTSPFSAGLIPPEGESTCEGYDLRKRGHLLGFQTVESILSGADLLRLRKEEISWACADIPIVPEEGRD